MDGKELYNHELTQNGISKIIEVANDMGMNMLELKKACDAISISCSKLIEEGFYEAYGEAPSED